MGVLGGVESMLASSGSVGRYVRCGGMGDDIERWVGMGSSGWKSALCRFSSPSVLKKIFGKLGQVEWEHV